MTATLITLTVSVEQDGRIHSISKTISPIELNQFSWPEQKLWMELLAADRELKKLIQTNEHAKSNSR